MKMTPAGRAANSPGTSSMMCLYHLRILGYFLLTFVVHVPHFVIGNDRFSAVERCA